MSSASKGREIAPASGKLGVLLPGMGAVATTFIAGVEAVRKRAGEADRQPDADGDRAARQAHGRPLAADQGLRAARVARSARVRRLGRLPRQRLRGGEEGGRARVARPRADQGLPGRHQAVAGGVRPAVRQEAERAEREEGQVEARPGRAGVGRHRALQEGEGPRAAGDGLVRLDRGVPRGGRRALHDREVREGPRREPPRHPALDDLRLLRDQGRHPVRQRRAEPLGRLPGDGRAREEDRARRSAARTSRPARR